jgi:hypothetical protein
VSAGRDAGDDEPVPPPSAAVLEALDSDRWAALLPLVRRALRELDGPAVTPAVERLRAAPTSRLAGGRSRRDLARLVAADGPLWAVLVEQLRAASPVPDELAWLLRGDAPPTPPPAAVPPPAGRVDHAADEVGRLRERLRAAGAKRDAARRQAEGEAARAAALEQELRACRAAIVRAEVERDAAREELAGAAADQQRAIERERRRQQARISELEAEVAALRRREEEWRTQLRRRDEREERLRAQVGKRSGDAPAPPVGVDRFVPGRPSQLPDEVAAGTTEAARLLLHPGRLLLVDGYNVTKTHRPQLDLEAQRSWLILRLGELAARSGVRPRVVFDGQQGGGARPASAWRGVAVRFTAAGITADDELVLDVEATDEPVTVVTDDQELTRRLRASGADVIGTRAFLGVVG